MISKPTENCAISGNQDDTAPERDSGHDATGTAQTNGSAETAGNILYMPVRPYEDAGDGGYQPPRQDADAVDRPDDGDGGGEDDDLDVLPFDELDEAAAQHKEDWRLPTVAWPEPVNGEEVFDDTVGIFNRFMVLPEGAAEVLSLWVFSTYALHACHLPFAVRLMITAPGANSGKTTLLDLLTYLVRHPEPTSDITPASLYRSLSGRKCVLLDEADHTCRAVRARATS